MSSSVWLYYSNNIKLNQISSIIDCFSIYSRILIWDQLWFSGKTLGFLDLELINLSLSSASFNCHMLVFIQHALNSLYKEVISFYLRRWGTIGFKITVRYEKTLDILDPNFTRGGP